MDKWSEAFAEIIGEDAMKMVALKAAACIEACRTGKPTQLNIKIVTKPKSSDGYTVDVTCYGQVMEDENR